MLAILKRRLTFANTLALAALFLSLTGGVYAASKINGSKIKKESIAGNRFKADGVTGEQIDEASLGKVPSAGSADNAQTLAGSGPSAFVSAADVRWIRFDRPPSSPPCCPVTQTFPILDLAPLKLNVVCSAGSMRIEATTSATGAGIDSGYAFDDSAFTRGGGFAGTTPTIVFMATGADQTHRAVGNIVYNDPNLTIEIPFAAFWAGPQSTLGNRCFVTGIATRTD